MTDQPSRVTVAWTCPACDEHVAVQALVIATSTPWDPAPTVRVNLTDTALADVYAHAWAHEQETAP